MKRLFLGLLFRSKNIHPGVYFCWGKNHFQRRGGWGIIEVHNIEYIPLDGVGASRRGAEAADTGLDQTATGPQGGITAVNKLGIISTHLARVAVAITICNGYWVSQK